MGLRKTLFALTYDRMSHRSEEAGVRALRQGLLAEASGSVLEIGAGTGANLRHYEERVESLVLTEPEPAMLRRLERKAREQAPLAKVLRAPAEDLPFEDASFDTVVSTLVLCGVDDQVGRWRRSGASSAPAGASCSSSTCGRTTRSSRASRTGSTGSTASSSTATATGRR